MRLMELVRCGRPAVVDESPLPSMSPEKPEKRPRLRRISHGGAVSTWQPSLGAISEDGAFLLPPAKSSPSPMKAGKNLQKGKAWRTAAARLGER
ncbi:hypothetical protein KFK09_002914 [Dendrobium nobile]|uniref:Uncharacterized protein n=1 Tax=Dendrobium nobile TaxID=94219 RepID=A0A8T3C682_DENNO|nr:hypothetical protein KFK09_002914 [Dendrobium nobile]